MATWFDESRLDDERALAGADLVLRELASSGARVRREATAAAETTRLSEPGAVRPRALLVAGDGARLVRSVLEQVCPVPLVALPDPRAGLPGWAGGLDLVVVLAPGGGDHATAGLVAEATRRGAQVVVACPPRSLVAEHAGGRHVLLLPTVTGDPTAAAVVVLDHLAELGLGPRADVDAVADALDEVAIACSPHRDLSVNPAKLLAIGLADTVPVLWGGSVLAARAARRVAEQVRATTGRSAVAGSRDQVLPLLEATRPRDVFADPFADPFESSLGGGAPAPEVRPTLVVVDDGVQPLDEVLAADRRLLEEAAARAGVRVERIEREEGPARPPVARYASLVLQGTYAAHYLRIATVED